MNKKNPNVPFYNKTVFRVGVLIAVFVWTMFKLGAVYAINKFGGVIIDNVYAVVFVQGLLPLYFIVYAVTLIKEYKWKWIYALSIATTLLAVLVKYVSATYYVLQADSSPLSSFLVDTVVEMIFSMMVGTFIVATLYTIGWRVLVHVMTLILLIITFSTGLLFTLSWFLLNGINPKLAATVGSWFGKVSKNTEEDPKKAG